MTQYETMTQASEAPLIAKLAVPSVLTMLVTNVYNLADTAFVGQLASFSSCCPPICGESPSAACPGERSPSTPVCFSTSRPPACPACCGRG